MELERTYREEFHKALEKCQFIEETLKVCIFTAIEIARIQVEPFFSINYKFKDIAKRPLGQLIKIFGVINNDTKLLTTLNGIRDTRNNIAHKALLFTLGELKDKRFMTEKISTMKNFVKQATDAHNVILDFRYKLLRDLRKLKHSRDND